MLKTILTALLLFLPVSAYSLERFTPKLTENKNPQLCSAFHQHLQDAYLQEKPKNWGEAFPDKKVLRLPPERWFGERDSFFLRLHTGKEDEENIFYLTVNRFEHGFRYAGGRLYIAKDSLQATNKFNVPEQEITETTQLSEDVVDNNFKYFGYFNPANPLYLIVDNGEIYYVIPDWTTPRGQGNNYYISLNRFMPDNQNEVTCAVQYTPSRNHYAEVQKLEAIQGLRKVYAAPGGNVRSCYGTIGWQAPPFMSSIIAAYEHPEKIPEGLSNQERTTYGGVSWQESLAGARLSLFYWGAQDPMSWAQVQKIEHGRQAFQDHLANYYKKYFQYDSEKAQQRAKDAWLFILNTIIYNKYPGVAPSPPHNMGVANADMSDLILETHDSNSLTGNIDAYLLADYTTSDLPALIYTRADKTKIEEAYKNLGTLSGYWRQSFYKSGIDASLLAAFGSPELMKLALSKGADVNSKTNDFGKTPLMYAAQLNNFMATNWLLSQGAQVNTKTEVPQYGCTLLQRDARTALMYAAENADEKVIQLLLKHGADSKAIDSKGNNILWYLDKNTLLSSKAKEKINAELTKLMQ